MKSIDLYGFLISEAEHSFSGWDFSYLETRIENAPLTWSYLSKILPFVRKSTSLLDMGTGGGEFLSILVPLPQHTCATEAYEPNVPIAKKRLEPLGVKVFYLEDEEDLPFMNNEFDLVINRHEYYNANEVYRILKNNGIFITQQVGDQNDNKLRLILTGKSNSGSSVEWNLDYAKDELEKVGFKIEEDYEDITYTRIFGVGAIAFYLTAIPWELPDFSVKKYYHKLVEINEKIKEKGYIDLDMNNHRFLIKAKKS
ncbi:MAG: class I SAM-dependent methyltransferase [Candidatus Thorarchaeota archaeon]